MYILNRGFCYSIIDTKSGIDIGKVFNSLEEIEEYAKEQLLAWKKEYKKGNKSKYSDYFILRQIENFESLLKGVK